MQYQTGTRRYKRYDVDELYGRAPFMENVSIVNISMGGVQIRTDRGFFPQSEYSLNMRGKSMNFTVTGRIVWSRMVGSEPMGNGQRVPVYTSGMMLVKNPVDTTEILQRFIHDSRQEKEERPPANMRFTLKGDHLAEIRAGCRIRKISKGGMLIETNKGFEPEFMLNVDIELDEGPVAVLCCVANCIQDPRTRKMLIGLEFKEISGDERKLLMAYVEGSEH